MPGCLALRILRPRSIARKTAQGSSSSGMAESSSSSGEIPAIIAALKACGRDRDLERARALHAGIVERGLDGARSISVANTVVDVYGKCGSLDEAMRAFRRMASHTTVSWTVLIAGCVDNGENAMAVDMFAEMEQRSRVVPDAWTFVAVIKACAGLAAQERGRLLDGKMIKLAALERGGFVHSRARRDGFDREKYVACSLISMYSRCGSNVDAQRVFEEMDLEQRDAAACNAMMAACVENGEPDLCLELFERMGRELVPPDRLSFVAALKACSISIRGTSLKLGICAALHDQAERNGFSSDIVVASSLIHCYGKCGNLADAEKVFEGMRYCDVVSWTSLMLGYVGSGHEDKALDLFQCMSRLHNQPDGQAFAAAIKAITGLAEKHQPQQEFDHLKVSPLIQAFAVHSQAQAQGVLNEKNSGLVIGNALIVLYAKCGSMPDAQRVFNRMVCPDGFSWTSLMLGYVENGRGDTGLEVFAAMVDSQGWTSLDVQAFATAFKACGSCANLEAARSISGMACRIHGLESVDAVLANALVDSFSKTGSIVHAQALFDSSPVASRELASWNSLMAGYARQGNSKIVVRMFDAMQHEATVRADATTLVCLLTACSHAGLVDDAQRYLEEMSSKHGIEPGIDHYSCVVDALARANKLDAAVMLAEAMPGSVGKESVAWRSVLGACCKWRNVAVGKLAFERLMELNHRDGAAYVLMDNITLHSQ